MIDFLSATPGSGKTLLAVEILYILSKDNIKNLKHNFFYAKAFFEKINQLEFDSYLRSLTITTGQGLERETQLIFFDDDFFDFLKKEYSINVVMSEYSDLEINFPEYYFERISLLNLIIDNLNENEKTKFDHFKVVRTIYTNIADLRLSQSRSLPKNCDWRKTPQGSFFVIDEAQLIPIFSEEARTIDPIVKELTIHRHKGYDFLFITQDPSFVNKYIRKLASHHTHLINIFGWEQSMKIEWTVVQENPNAVRSLSRSENISRWRFPEHVYKLYKSSTIHTRKKRIPKKLVFLSILAVIFFSIAIMLLFRDSALKRFLFGQPVLELSVESKNESKPNTGTDKTADASKSGSALDTSSASEPVTNASTKDQISSSAIHATTDADGNSISATQPEPVYDPADPYSYIPVSKPAVVNHRVFSGCVSYSGKHYAVDQQGTFIKQFSASDCKKLLDKSYNRPFDYFGNRTPPPPPPEPTTEENESTTYKQSLIQNIARLDAEKQHRAQNAEVKDESIPFGEPNSKYLDSANRY